MRLVLVRHGESVWNKENKFTGWTDVELSEKGIEEAKKAGLVLKEKGYHFVIAFTSVLKRAEDTLKYIMDSIPYDLKVVKDYRLNERHYGALQGLKKEKKKKKYGEEQVKIWRRSFDVQPPALSTDDERYPGNDEKYVSIPKEKLPTGESLKDTLFRVREFYDENIKGKKEYLNEDILIVAHGNSLRALIKDLENISDEDIVNLEIPTGKPIVYEIDEMYNVISKEVL